jgi:hypothetical protein
MKNSCIESLPVDLETRSLVKKLPINLERKTKKCSLEEITSAGIKNAGNSLIQKLPLDLFRIKNRGISHVKKLPADLGEEIIGNFHI